MRYLCYFESIFVCLFLIELDVTFYRYCLLAFAPTTTLKNFNPTKDIGSVLSNLDKRIVVKIKLCIIYLKYRFFSARKISRVVAVPTVKKYGKIKQNFHEKHTLQRDAFLKIVYRMSVWVHCYIFFWEISFNGVAFDNVFYLYKYYLYESSLIFFKFVLFHDPRSNDSRSNNGRFMYKLSKSV